MPKYTTTTGYSGLTIDQILIRASSAKTAAELLAITGASLIGVDSSNAVTMQGEVEFIESELISQQAEIDTHETRLDGIDITISNLDTDNIANTSSVTGTTTTNALNSLKSDIDALTVGDSNALIGVYSINASGTNTLTGTYTDLTYYTGLKINLKIANRNTSSVTFNLNSIGAKNIKVFNTDGTKSSLVGGELSGIITIEYDGTDFVWINGSLATYSTPTTSTKQITSLDTTVVSGQVNTTLQGNTVIELSQGKGNCEDTSFFTASVSTLATDTSNYIFGSKSIVATAVNASGAFTVNLSNSYFLIDATKYYFVSAYVRNIDAQSVRLRIGKGSSISTQVGSDSSIITATTWTRVGIILQPSDISGETSLYVRGYGISNGIGTRIAIEGIMPMEITSTEYALGADTLMLKYAWISDIGHTEPTMIKSVGKNLLPLSSGGGTLNGLNVSSDGESVNIDGTATADTYIKLTGGISLASSATATWKTQEQILPYYSGSVRFSWNRQSGTPSSDTGIRAGTRGKLTGTFYTDTTITEGNDGSTIADGLSYAFVYVPSGKTLSNFIFKPQLEYGSTATTYEAYKESTVYTTPTLRSVSDTIKDTFHCNNGLHTQNVTYDNDISSTDYNSHDTSTYTNVDVTKTTAFSGIVTQTTSADGTTKLIDKNNKILEEVSAANIDLVASNGKYYTHTDGTAWFITTAGTYADIAAARTGLGTSRIVYKLATPIVTQYPQGILDAEPNGTIYNIPVIQDIIQYSSGITIADTSKPISNLLYVNLFDTTTGVKTPIALSSCTIASNGLSFTISGASSEYYDYAYEYIGVSTIGDVYYSYCLNEKAARDSDKEQIKLMSNKMDMIYKLINP